MATARSEASTPVPADLLRQLAEVLPEERVTPGEAIPEERLVDWLGRWRGRAAALVRPRSAEEVAALLGLAAGLGLPVVPQGGNTGLVGGSVPDASGGAILLGLERLNRVLSVDPLDYSITLEAGCLLADAQRAAAEADRLLPLSLGAEGSCQVGGNVATNAGGIHVLRYGTTRELVLGLEVALPDGTLWDGLKTLRKDNTGYDLKQLFIGSEGTLGVVTKVALKLFPAVRSKATAYVSLTGAAAACELLAIARELSGDRVEACELLSRVGLEMAFAQVADTRDPLAEPADYYLLFELASPRADDELGAMMEDILERALERGLVADGTIAESEAQAAGLWHLREAIVEGQRLAGPQVKQDVSVSPGRVPELLAALEALYAERWQDFPVSIFGHVGDGNLHVNLSAPPGSGAETAARALGEVRDAVIAETAELVEGLRGSISAEHGLGRSRRELAAGLRGAPASLLMRRLKAAVDPQGLMNPDVLLPAGR